jgi:hypothetical protein
MSIVQILIENTDPITALILIFILFYLRNIRENLKEELKNTRKRVERLENHLLDDDE